MIDKGKLLQWIEDKHHVFGPPYDAVTYSREMIASWKGSVKVLNSLERAIELGEFDEEEKEERYEDRIHFKMDANGNLTRIEDGE